ncbi:MAG TPA: ankyrin repeat domain-containing protein [Gemmatimonadaceae bacterium]|nr:ankyrin repeat domain-containing protein [Gemmatimonadaceae bacterium]
MPPDASAQALDEFIRAACVPRSGSHADGTLDDARRVLGANPALPSQSIHAAAIVGDDELVRSFIRGDASIATRRGGPYDWDALTHLCFSRYLRLEPDRSPRFARAAEALLAAGADANAGFNEPGNAPTPEWEPVLYGAAGVAHDAAVTRLLVARGANVNDPEVGYHTPETWDNGALQALLDSGRVNDETLAMMLLRKADWHDLDGVRMLLKHGADPNRMTQWGNNSLHNAVVSDNGIEIVEAMLDSGADPTRPNEVAAGHAARGRGKTAVAMAAWNGRRDLLELFAGRGFRPQLDGIESLVAACARGDDAAIQSITSRDPDLVQHLRSLGADLLAPFARVGNMDGVRHLLDLGVDPRMTVSVPNGYWDTALASTALHVAAWLARHDVVGLLLERGASVDARDARGRTPLALAVKAAVDSYWTRRRAPDSVVALLRAGANANAPSVRYPSGYDEIDTLLARARAVA